MMKKLLKFFKEEEGISAVEYALLLAFIAAGIAAAAYLLGGAVRDRINSAASEISNPPASN